MICASATRVLVAAIALIGSLAGSATAQGTPTSAGDIPAILAPPASSVLLFELGARGVQIYGCEAKPDDATAFVWTFKAPEAELVNGRGEVVGTHFAGPTWQGQDGSAVVGAVLERADAPDPGAIPWLLLEAKEHVGSGAFSTITYVQRLDTAGGVAPSRGLRCGPRRRRRCVSPTRRRTPLLPDRTRATGRCHTRCLRLFGLPPAATTPSMPSAARWSERWTSAAPHIRTFPVGTRAVIAQNAALVVLHVPRRGALDALRPRSAEAHVLPGPPGDARPVLYRYVRIPPDPRPTRWRRMRSRMRNSAHVPRRTNP